MTPGQATDFAARIVKAIDLVCEFYPPERYDADRERVASDLAVIRLCCENLPGRVLSLVLDKALAGLRRTGALYGTFFEEGGLGAAQP